MDSDRLNKPVLTAAGLMFLTSLVHVFAGGIENYDPLRASALGDVPRSVFSVLWHFVTAFLLLAALALGWLARHANRALGLFLVAVLASFGIIFIVYGLADFGSLLPMPQWSVFFLVSGLVIWGQRV